MEPGRIYLNAQHIAGVSQRVLQSSGTGAYIPKRVWISSAEQTLGEIGHFRTQADIAFVCSVIAGPTQVNENTRESALRIIAIICRRFFILLLTYQPGEALNINWYRKAILHLLKAREEVTLGLNGRRFFRETDPELAPRLANDQFRLVVTNWDNLRGTHTDRTFADRVLESKCDTINHVNGGPFAWRDYTDDCNGPKFRWWEPRGYQPPNP